MKLLNECPIIFLVILSRYFNMYRLVERCAALIKIKDESRTNKENDSSSTDELDDDIDDGGRLNKNERSENMQNLNENIEDNHSNTCELSSVQENTETMSSEPIREGIIDSVNGFENVQNSQIHSEMSRATSDCKEKTELDISVT